MDMMQNRNLLYIGYYVDENTFETAIKNGNHDLSRARQNFEKHLLTEFVNKLNENDFSVVSFFPSSSGVSEFSSFINDKKIDVFSFSQSLGNCFRAYNAFRKYLIDKIDKQEKPFEVILYSLQPVFTIACFSLRKRLNLRITTICSELPQYRAAGNKISFARRLKIKLQEYLNRHVDQYILFSAAMRQEIPVEEKPSIVVEGIAPEIESSNSIKKSNIVMYAGGLGKQNNIRILIEACNNSKFVDQLWICGDGDELEYVKANTSDKIKYLGNLSNAEVLGLEKQAKVLINLRDPNVLITKYAFPSKVLEYLSVGTAVVSTVLEGIPNEYYNYVKPVFDLTIDGVTKCIDEVLNLSDQDYKVLCDSGRQWVTKNKTATAQAQKIIEFIFQQSEE